ncbi:MAG: TldD/PmbA family protein, partial [Nitrosopumilaceae archaeon]|nr:TldD/PmbA family protein [Nitrosopumilaceae archaeon]NIU01332.1 TldD/PmbA family protein [Nitrosopumilaceae archaeon]NIU88330.1 TldD/PmbA family protein [Nitrosopumilaceae archaeon]NIV66622.1 TldD/PmbA family protein [Nitrosopumilaceae archaeon]NIX61934.1 TldD/PmbA family protein [Nitrosopumilaceae archaeon]
FEIANSHGLHLSDKGTYISGIINADSEFGESQVSGLGHASCRTLDQFAPEKVGNEAKTMCLQSINPKKCTEDTYSIIFEP